MFVGSGISSIVLLISGTFFTQKSTITLATFAAVSMETSLPDLFHSRKRFRKPALMNDDISVMYFPSAGMVNQPRILSAEAFSTVFMRVTRTPRKSLFIRWK